MHVIISVLQEQTPHSVFSIDAIDYHLPLRNHFLQKVKQIVERKPSGEFELPSFGRGEFEHTADLFLFRGP